MANIYELNNEKMKNTSKKFSEQEVDLTNTPLFFPEGYEQLFVAIYFILLPYMAGLLFQFFYIAKLKLDVFLALNNSIILTWAIGYEIIAAIVLLFLIRESIEFSKEIKSHALPEFQRPT